MLKKIQLNWNRDNIAKHLSAWSTVVLAAITLWYVFLTRELVQLNESLTKQVSRQTELLSNSYLRSLEAQLTGEYTFPGRDEFFTVKNTGAIAVENLIANTRLYFINRRGDVQTTQGLRELLSSKPTFLKLARRSGLLRAPNDVVYLLSGPRELFAGRLDIGERTTFEAYPSVNANAIKLADELGFKVVVRWRLTYIDPIDSDPHTTKLFFLIEPNNNRRNLANVLGGQTLIAALSKFEETTQELIFGFDKSSKK